MKDLLFKLCDCPGFSGNENDICNLASKELYKYAKVSTDKNLNVIATLGKEEAKKHILLDAHIDQIGMIVTNIDDKGFVRVSPCGGIDRRVLPGSIVKIFGKEVVDGIVCSTPPHLEKKSDEEFLPVDKLVIDTGLRKGSIKEKIRLGDRASYYSKPRELMNGRVAACAIDNRAGVVALIETAKALSKEELGCKVTILLSSREETGAMGAKTGTYSITPDEAICVDVTFGDQPQVLETKSGKISRGPMVGVSPILSNLIIEKLKNISCECEIPSQIEVMSGKTGTNADSISVTKKGVPTGLLSIPIRYMHTAAEVVDVSDIENTVKILSEYVKRGGV